MSYLGAGITRFNTADDLTVTDDAEIKGELSVDGAVDLNTSLNVDGTVTADFATISAASDARIEVVDTSNSATSFIRSDNTDASIGTSSNHPLNIRTNGNNAITIDTSQNVLVGKTAASIDTVGVEARANGRLSATMDGDVPLDLNRLTSDGNIALFRKDGSTVGSIGVDGSAPYFATALGSTLVGIKMQGGSTPRIIPTDGNGDSTDGVATLGFSSSRFDDIYATNGTIQTSDRNEKQDIEELTEAEQRVAVAAKGLLRKFRWKDAVAEKGDDARIHFGIIAQDLQAAFEAEGLDAGRYAMFIYSEWWETYTDVPAVEAQDAVYETVVIPAVTEERLVSEAVLDEEGNEIEAAVYETVVVEEETTEERLVSEAVEAKEAYTRTDTYHTEEEAPEGAVKKDRMGVRYSELLAFIIAAI